MRQVEGSRIPLLVAAGVVLLTVTGCGGSAGSSASSSTSPATPTAAPDLLSWSAVDIPSSRIDAAIDSLDGIAEKTMKETGIPGMSIAVVRDGKVVYAKGFGVRKVGTTDGVNADTIFQVASVSKPIGASVVASVVGTGKVAWTDPVSKYLPDFALSDPYVTKNATIGDLYAMRSGLPDEAGDTLEWMGYNREQVLQRLRYLPLAPFRAEYHYTNFGLTAGAQAVADAAGIPWEELSKQRLYAPLGMTRTTSNYAEFLKADNRATLHTKVNGAYGAHDIRDPQAQSPAGGVSTSANDMAKWMIMELGQGNYQGKQVVSAEALQESFVPRMTSRAATAPAQRSGQIGYGILVDTDSTGRMRYSFSGAFEVGAATTFTLVPSEKLGISVFTNAAPLGAAEAVSYEFLDRAETGSSSQDWLAVMGKVYESTENTPTPPPTPSAPSAPAPLTNYTGVYTNTFYGPVTVTVEGGGLVAKFGPAARTFSLRPYDGNKFSAQVPYSDVWLPSVTFTVPDGGPATSVTFGQFDDAGQGTFTRAAPSG